MANSTVPKSKKGNITESLLISDRSSSCGKFSDNKQEQLLEQPKENIQKTCPSSPKRKLDTQSNNYRFSESPIKVTLNRKPEDKAKDIKSLHMKLKQENDFTNSR